MSVTYVILAILPQPGPFIVTLGPTAEALAVAIGDATLMSLTAADAARLIVTPSDAAALALMTGADAAPLTLEVD